MKTTINQRIEAIRTKMNIKSVLEFAKIVGVPQTSLNGNINNNQEPRFSRLSKILNTFPTISAEWLMREEGDMLKEEGPVVQESPAAYEQPNKGEIDRIYQLLREKDALLLEQSKEIGRLQEQLRAQEKDVPGAISTDGARVG